MARRFEDRAEAGHLLAKAIGARDPEQTLVLALPRGGVPVAAEIARGLGAPLDLIFVRKIGVPHHPELAVGAIAEGPEPQIVINKDIAQTIGMTEQEIEALTPPLLAEMARRREAYLGGRPPLPLEGKTAIVVDDGAATGATFKTALLAIAKAGATRMVAALPVAPPRVVKDLWQLCDEVICLNEPHDFGAVGQYYRQFLPVDDAQVLASLDAAAGPGKANGKG